MTVLICGAGPGSDGLEELIASGALQLGRPGGAGSIMRAHPGHFAQLDRAETEAYVPWCCCGWVASRSYGDVGDALGCCAEHMRDPDAEPAGVAA